jgi:hypothetical protein
MAGSHQPPLRFDPNELTPQLREMRALSDSSRTVVVREGSRARTWSAHVLANVQGLFDQGPAAVVATRDAAMRPQISRAWAPELLGDHSVRVCVDAADGSSTRRNLVDWPEIALTAVRPSSYRSAQLKGIVLLACEPSEAQLAAVRTHTTALAADIVQVGMSPRSVSRILDVSRLLSVSFALLEVYDQTPGLRAGSGVEPR